jgi:hypothetical protein
VVEAREGSKTIVVDLASTAPGLGLVDALARLQLLAGRLGCSIQLRNATRALQELIELVGLTDVLLLEADGEPESGEQLGVEKVVKPGDPAV